MERIVLFDGDCHFCHESVLFIIHRDKYDLFKFCSLQSETAYHFKQTYSDNSLILIENNRIYTKSTAALRISRLLSFPWYLLYALIIIPKKVRDPLYTLIANNRYKLMKRQTKCSIPSKKIKNKFL